MTLLSVYKEKQFWIGIGLVGALGFFLFPADAWAWGPVAHIDFSMQIIAGAGFILPALTRLIQRHKDDFLYGSLMADMVVGKNLASDKEHCHSWEVAKQLVVAARDESDETQAMVAGYIAHLAADVVAHNHFVPGRLVANYRAVGVGHLYWEARFDQKLLEHKPAIGEIWHELSTRSFREHDQFLMERITPTLFPHRVSHGLYRSSLVVQRRKPWQGAVRRIDSRSKMPLTPDEVDRWRLTVVAVMQLALADHNLARVDRLDPTGMDALRVAVSMRHLLRKRQNRVGIEDPLLKSTTPSVPPPSIWEG